MNKVVLGFILAVAGILIVIASELVSIRQAGALVAGLGIVFLVGK
jgi:hypothetical protein